MLRVFFFFFACRLIKGNLDHETRAKSDTEYIQVDVTEIHLVLKDLHISLLTDK